MARSFSPIQQRAACERTKCWSYLFKRNNSYLACSKDIAIVPSRLDVSQVAFLHSARLFSCCPVSKAYVSDKVRVGRRITSPGALQVGDNSPVFCTQMTCVPCMGGLPTMAAHKLFVNEGISSSPVYVWWDQCIPYRAGSRSLRLRCSIVCCQAHGLPIGDSHPLLIHLTKPSYLLWTDRSGRASNAASNMRCTP